MPPSRSSRFRKLVGFAGLSVAAVAGSALFAGAAFAHHPEVAVTTDCTGVVHFTSTAWQPATDAQRTNPRIGVAYEVDGGSFVDLPQKPEYHYDAANGFSFSDELPPLDAGWHEVTVQVTALGQWGSGYQGPDSREASVLAPTDCTTPAQPSATVADASCADHGAVVTLVNEGGEPVDFDVSGDTVTVGPNATVEHTVTFPGDTGTTITVSAPGMDDVVDDVEYSCASTTPAPPAETPAAPAAPEQPVAATTEVSPPAAAEVPAEVPAVSAPVAVEVLPTGDATTAAPAPTTSIPGEVLAAEATAPAAGASSGTLPFTGNEIGPLALTALGSVLTGLALTFAGRRRTQG
jgi:hypothetical protein